ncbi:hypothetical protein GEV33_000758 [Tenebrio molitor]|uniref:Uncharacterized protein n=1 Tax=Tenebrio molitor TaxID=7067 RepID=A0A8J6HYZ8_TENMO|nr:hypothetical protein GEV33_000758 [Tenebrio molitor]
MKPLFVFLLLIVVVSVVRGATEGSVCISKCDEEEQKCSDDFYCVILTTNKGRKLRRAMDVCVCLVGADGRVVEGRINTLSATTARSARVRVPSGKGGMGVGCRGKCPGAPSHHLKEGEDR